MEIINSVREEHMKHILGEELVSFIKSVNILVIGAGGIGCELLKNLVLSGFLKISVIDLDRIDISNLNRQFLFKKIHVGESKAHTAKEAVLEYNHKALIESYEGNIKDEKFSTEFFKNFDVILNALDNNDTRKHVNRICLAADKILIDSGSTGYNGQVVPILNKQTLCFECENKPAQKSFPICTIRQTPEKPEHCIAWSKMVFELLFGPEDENNLLFDLKQEIQAHEVIDNMDKGEYARHVFNYLFNSEIKKQNELKNSSSLTSSSLVSLSAKLATPVSYEEAVSGDDTTVLPTGKLKSQIVWTLKECALKFTECIKRMHNERKDLVGISTFDKDNDLCMDFVTAASNLRMHNFHILPKSRWEVQSIAGAIIPAVASTNAIVAGVQVVELFHCIDYLMKKKKLKEENVSKEYSIRDSNARHVWISKNVMGKDATTLGRVVLPETLEKAKESCFVCQQQLIKIVLHSLKKWTLKDFVQNILQGYMGTNNPMLDTIDRCIYDPDEETDKVKMNLSLEEWGVKNGSILTVTDYTQGDFQCSLLLSENSSLFNVEKDAQLFFFEKEHKKNENKKNNDDVLAVEEGVSVQNSTTDDGQDIHCEKLNKRKRHMNNENKDSITKPKKAKLSDSITYEIEIDSQSNEDIEIQQNGSDSLKLKNEGNETDGRMYNENDLEELQEEIEGENQYDELELEDDADEEIEIIDASQFGVAQEKNYQAKFKTMLQINQNNMIANCYIDID